MYQWQQLKHLKKGDTYLKSLDFKQKSKSKRAASWCLLPERMQVKYAVWISSDLSFLFIPNLSLQLVHSFYFSRMFLISQGWKYWLSWKITLIISRHFMISWNNIFLLQMSSEAFSLLMFGLGNAFWNK